MQRERAFYIKVEWDNETETWYVSGSDVPGLNVEAANVEEMLETLQSLIPELLEVNGVFVEDSDTPGVPYSIMFDQLRTKRIEC